MNAATTSRPHQQDARSEYLPHDSEATPQNGNGNGHAKAFRLAPIVTPEEEARTEVLREIAPKIRRKVREDSRLSAGAKFFFYALFDDAFWHAVGGHGTGQVFADIRTLSDRYGHDEKSIQRWRVELVESGWLWTNYEWPMTEWRLTPLLPAPSNSPQKKAIQMALGRAAKPVGETPTTSRTSGKPRHLAPTPDESGQNGGSALPSCPTPVGEMPVSRGRLGGELVGETPTSVGRNAHDPPPECPRASGMTPTSVGQNAHEQKASRPEAPANPTRPLGRNGGGEKSPGEGRNGSKEGKGITPPGGSWDSEFEKWQRGLEKKFDRELRSTLDDLKAERTKLREFPPQDAAEKLRRVKLKIEAVNVRLTGPK